MPKVTVVFIGDEMAAEAEAAAAGAKSVRFTEVEVRAAQATTRRYKPLDGGSASDGFLFVANEGSAAESLSVLAGLVNENTVLASAGPRAMATEVASRGGIVVSVAAGDVAALGARVAKVAGWVRHALGHEADSHAHAHADAHSHTHAPEHDHEHHHHAHDDHKHLRQEGAIILR